MFSLFNITSVGFAGKNEKEAGTIDMIVDSCEDMNKPLRPIVVESDVTRKVIYFVFITVYYISKTLPFCAAFRLLKCVWCNGLL